MKTFIGILIFFLLLPILYTVFVHTKYPFRSYTEPLTIQLKDARTGEPIPGAIIEARWLKQSVWLPLVGLGGSASVDFLRKSIMTDKDGMATIPEHSDFHPFSVFHNVMMRIVHPLYEPFDYFKIYGKNGQRLHPPVDPNSKTYKEYYKETYDTLDIHNSQNVSIRLRRIRDKFQNARCIAKKLEEFKTETKCTENGGQLFYDIGQAEQYFLNHITQSISGYDGNLVPDRSKCLEEWRATARIVYSNSPYKPHSLAKNEN